MEPIKLEDYLKVTEEKDIYRICDTTDDFKIAIEINRIMKSSCHEFTAMMEQSYREGALLHFSK